MAHGKHLRRRRGTHRARDLRLIAACAALCLVSVGGLAVRVVVVDPPAPDVVTRAASLGSDGMLTLTFAGDTMIGDGSQPVVDAHGYDYVFADARSLLHGDVVVINAEAPITTSSTPARPGASYSYASNPKTARAMATAGVHVLALGNNHALDMGPIGLQDTRDAAAAAGMSTFGAGADLAQAERPLVVTAAKQKIAVVSLGEDFGPTMRSAPDRPGMVAFTPERIMRGLDLAHRAGATKVIAMVHWGDNYATVNASQKTWGRALAQAGYDLVIGTGPHTTQPIEIVDGTPVLYSIGNFVFGAPGRYATFGQVGIGVVVDVNWGPDGSGAGRLTLRCLQTDNADVHYVPRACDAPHLADARRLLGQEVSWHGPVGTVTF